MDIATILGIMAGFGLIVWGIGTGNVKLFFDIPSLLIVCGGTLGAVLVNYPMRDVLGAYAIAIKAFHEKRSDPKGMILMLVEFGRRARHDGILSLEKTIPELQDPFIKKGVQLAVDGMEPQVIMRVLELEIEQLRERHKTGADIIMTFGVYAPAFGMIGTLIGLVLMLKQMDNPSTIGPNMAIALITTFYGAIMANMLFLPMAGKLRKRSAEEILIKEMTLEGILSIASGDNPRITEEKLQGFILPRQREIIIK